MGAHSTTDIKDRAKQIEEIKAWTKGGPRVWGIPGGNDADMTGIAPETEEPKGLGDHILQSYQAGIQRDARYSRASQQSIFRRSKFGIMRQSYECGRGLVHAQSKK